MGLSYDIISEFVKITNDDRSKPREGTVYATIVKTSDGKFVKIDGSDLLTPTETTTDIEDGERVTVMIKDHTATVTGNVSSPSASSNRVDKVVDSVTEQIGVFETVVADKVSVNELEAYKATIEILIAGKAEIEDLEAIYAKIENLEVKDAEIENAVIDKATIEDLEAINAKIENLEVKDAEIENAVIENLEATTAEIKILNADFAQIKTLVSGNLTSDNILSFNITADKVTMEDAFIKDAMIDTISAGKINAGQINTNAVTIGSEDGGMRISGATQQFTDKNGNVRIQIGRDSSGDFTFVLYGEDGTGQIINQNGITASAISDGLIVNDMVSDNASISGGKLDISSVITEINNDGSTTIKSNKIYLDEQNQSLEVAFNSLKSQVDTIQDVTIDGDLTTVVEQVQSNTSKIEVNASSINTLVSQDEIIKKQVTDLEGNVVETTNELKSKYTSLTQNLDGFKTTVANTYATKSSVNDVKNNLSSNYSTTSAMNSAIQQKVDEIKTSVSSTYATKKEVESIDTNIKTNYSTTEQMESAISVAKNEINLGVSQIYETKTDVSSKVNSTLTSAKSYADTKKTEAINSASSDATAKANSALTSAKTYTDTAKNELNTAIGKKANSSDVYTKTEVYTKTQTDSAIKLAKDNIELGVSNKYETKTEVQNKIDTNISSAVTTLKEYTDSKIKIASDSITQTVSKTYATKAEFENLSVGGENLILNSNFKYGLTSWKASGASSPYFSIHTDGTLRYYNTGATSDDWYQTYTNPAMDVGDIAGKQIVLSVDCKVVNASVLSTKNIAYIRFYDEDHQSSSSQADAIKYTNLTIPSTYTNNTWVRVSEVITVPSNAKYARVAAYVSANGEIYWKRFKLEEGNKATPWSASSSDALIYIDSVSDDISENITDLSTIIANNTGSDTITAATKVQLVSEFDDITAIYNKLNSIYDGLGDTSMSSLKTDMTTKYNAVQTLATSLSSTISQTSPTGLANAVETYSTFYITSEELHKSLTNAITNKTLETSTEVSQLADSYTITANKMESLENNVSKITTSFKFDSDGLTIKSSADSKKHIKLDNDSLDFMDNGQMVAQISDSQLNISNAKIGNQLKVGNILIKPSGRGGLMFVYE